ncbi:glutathione S-transferase family protein [Niveispirillum sp. KHB5.9]|uniref:glutathione S-transferase family protein n=1 Tax=Niveispirillum sp. KHB5.9 TaxID=3400269 RepID=UPI003A8B0507
MIKLHAFGPAFGLPDPSPYITKTEVQLRMAGLAYEKVKGDLEQTPKHKLPIIEDDGRIVADSTFIRTHIERTRSIDLDEGLSLRERAEAWAVERMLEDHLCWAMVHERWMDDENFRRGPALFFQGAPDHLRDAIIQDVRARVTTNMYAHGIGRHSAAERLELANRSLSALAVLLGDKPFLMGDRPTGVDAFAFALLAGLMSPQFDTPIRQAAEAHGAFGPYVRRMAARFYPGHAWWWDREAAAA